MDNVYFHQYELSERIVAIVSFGPPSPDDGFRPATYYQVTIDPEKVSPTGEYVRFGTYPGDELLGWQRCAAIAIREILSEWPKDKDSPSLQYAGEEVQSATFMKVVDVD